jgi:hypothetical protein
MASLSKGREEVIAIVFIFFFFSFRKLYIYIPKVMGVKMIWGNFTIAGDWMMFLGSLIS